MSKKENPVTSMSIIQFPIGHKQEEVFCYVRPDRELIDAACRYADKLRESDVEIFERKGNVLATDKGYFAILFDEEIRSQPGNIDNPTPFKGKDGRMKVNIKTEKGEWTVQDLADLVAKKFIPNLHLRKKVWFKDANVENCQADNLYFVPTWKYWFLKTFKIKKNGTVIRSKNRP